MEEVYIGVKEVIEVTGLCRKTIHTHEKTDVNFPKRLQVGGKLLPAYNKQEIENWYNHHYNKCKNVKMIDRLIQTDYLPID